MKTRGSISRIPPLEQGRFIEITASLAAVAPLELSAWVKAHAGDVAEGAYRGLYKLRKTGIPVRMGHWDYNVRMVRMFFEQGAGRPLLPPVETLRRERYSMEVGPGGRERKMLVEYGYLQPDGVHWSKHFSIEVGGRTYTGQSLNSRMDATVPCNAKCVDAAGPDCTCSCGGANHGSGLTVYRILSRTNSEIADILALQPVTGAQAPELLAKLGAAEDRARVAFERRVPQPTWEQIEAWRAHNARVRYAVDARKQGTWLSPSDYAAMRSGIYDPGTGAALVPRALQAEVDWNAPIEDQQLDRLWEAARDRAVRAATGKIRLKLGDAP